MQKQLLIKEVVLDISGTINFVERTVKFFHAGDTILLYGNIGSGKTLLTREYTRMLGSHAEVSSPSFSLINRYEGPCTINHIDLYRIKEETELINLGLEDILFSDGINFIEWPERIEQKILWSHFRIDLRTKKNNLSWRTFRLFKIHE